MTAFFSSTQAWLCTGTIIGTTQHKLWWAMGQVRRDTIIKWADTKHFRHDNKWAGCTTRPHSTPLPPSHNSSTEIPRSHSALYILVSYQFLLSPLLVMWEQGNLRKAFFFLNLRTITFVCAYAHTLCNYTTLYIIKTIHHSFPPFLLFFLSFFFAFLLTVWYF